MAPSKRVALYWRGSGGIRSELLGSLERRGFEIAVVRTKDALLAKVSQGKPQLIVVDATAGEKEALNRVSELEGVEVLHSVPLLFFSTEASKRTATLQQEYSDFQPVDFPFISGGFEEQIAEHVVKSPQVSKGDGKFKISDDDSFGPHVWKSSRLTLDPSALDKSFGGKVFASASSAAAFDDDLLLPQGENQKAVKAVLDKLTAEDPWLGAHARRTAYVASAVSNSLAVGPTRDAALRTSALLLNWCFLGQEEEGSRIDFLEGNQIEALDSMANAITESLDRINNLIKDPIVVRTMQTIVQILERKKVYEKREIVEDAKSALTSELIDRACWKTGHWDSFGAYQALKELKREEGPFFLEDEMAMGFGRVLSEAVTSRIVLGNVLLPGMLKSATDLDLLAHADKEAKKLFGLTKPLLVPIGDLKAGMVTARPIVTHEKKIVLEAGVRLDNNLIWRLWQLAALRPMSKVIAIAPEFARGPMRHVP